MPTRGGARGLSQKGTDLNSRRLLLLAAALMAALTLAAPAAAAPRHYKVLGKARHHLGKPAHKQLIAVRHGHRIHWFSKTHGLPKHKLPPIKLSANVKFAHAGIRAFGPTSAPTVTGTGSCNFGPTLMTPDGMSYVQSYGSLAADVMSCVGNNGGNTEANSFFPSPTCSNSAAKSVHDAPLVVATFVDGEWMALCTVPDDNGVGGSAANTQHAPYVVYQQGFPCQAAVGTGSSGNSAFIAKTNDSLEYSQTYTENGQTVKALTTSCIGQLPSNKTAPSTPVAHLVSCTQYDPNHPGKFVKGLGETITYPDGQFQETCNVPDYSNSVACTSGTDCSTDVGADETSNLRVTESPTSDGTLTETVDNGAPLSCAGEQFGGYTGFDPNWYGFSYTGSGSKVLTYDLFTLPFNSDRDVEVCFGATERFNTVSDDGSAQPGTLPDGTPGFIGLLPSCDSVSGAEPCVESIGPISSEGPSGTQVTVLIPESFTADPFGHI
jgi:hypothetical protein